MKAIKFNNLYIVQQEVQHKQQIQIKEKTNHIWLYDRSGSMDSQLPLLTKQLIDLSKKIPKGDTLSLGWFSGEGQFNFIIKGFKVIDDADYISLQKIINNNSSSIGCTCFSEIIHSTNQVIDDLSVLSKVFSFSLFTDGYPCVSSYDTEISNIFSGIKKIKGKLTTAMIIGYGNYYNKDLLTKMAKGLSAMLIHNKNINEFTPTMIKLVNLSETSNTKIEVESIFKNPMVIYTITEQGVVLLNSDDGIISLSPESNKNMYIYYITNDLRHDYELIDNFDDILYKAIYAGAYVLCQHMHTDKAMELINVIGDKYYIDALTNSFTIEEYGKTESELNHAINNIDNRFKSGKDTNYLPPSDAFCVFDVLTILMNDDSSAFYPYDSRFAYNKISKSTEVEDGFSKFNANVSASCGFNDLTWHQSRLNLSVSTTIKGTITLQPRNGKCAKDFGFIDEYPTWVYRTYTFIKDGIPNIKTFYVTSSENTYKLLKNKGVIIDDTFKKNKTYGIDISNLPAINRQMVNNNTSGKELCTNIYNELLLMAKLKVYKYFLNLNNKNDEDDLPIKSFTDEQKQYLIENGISVDKGGLYSPSLKSGILPEDFYFVKRFTISVKGCSNIPAVESVINKINSKKSLTLSESIVSTYINEYNSLKDKNSIEVEINKAKYDLKLIRQKIQKTKFSLILGKKTIDEFTNREQNTLTLDIGTFIFKYDEEKVNI